MSAGVAGAGTDGSVPIRSSPVLTALSRLQHQRNADDTGGEVFPGRGMISFPPSASLLPSRQTPSLLPASQTPPMPPFFPWLFPGRSIRCLLPSLRTCLATWITRTWSMSSLMVKRRTSPGSGLGLALQDHLSLGHTGVPFALPLERHVPGNLAREWHSH